QNIGKTTGYAALVDKTDGRLAPQTPFFSGPVNAIVADGAGGWYVGGAFLRVAGEDSPYLAHINADLSLDVAWRPEPDAPVTCLAHGADGALYVGGDFSEIAGVPHARLAAFDPAGAFRPDWTPELDGTPLALAVGADKVFVG